MTRSRLIDARRKRLLFGNQYGRMNIRKVPIADVYTFQTRGCTIKIVLALSKIFLIDLWIGHSLSTWKALAARITLFSRPVNSTTPELSPLDLYKKIWAADPDNYQKSPAPVFPSQAQGKRGDLQATCLVHSTRIDFNFSPVAPKQISNKPTLQLIENTEQLHTELQRITTVLANGDIQTSAIGVALYLQFVAPQPGFEEANSEIMTIIPEQYRTTLTNEEGFVFQINRPHTSSQLPNIRMNFVTKWSVERAQVVTFSLPTQGGPIINQQQMPMPNSSQQQMPIPSSTEFIMPSIVFDFNNSPYLPDTNLTSEQQSLLLLEGLSRIDQTQHELGLNFSGFNHATSVSI